jgi:hypothetical protein
MTSEPMRLYAALLARRNVIRCALLAVLSHMLPPCGRSVRGRLALVVVWTGERRRVLFHRICMAVTPSRVRLRHRRVGADYYPWNPENMTTGNLRAHLNPPQQPPASARSGWLENPAAAGGGDVSRSLRLVEPPQPETRCCEWPYLGNPIGDKGIEAYLEVGADRLIHHPPTDFCIDTVR